MKMYKNGLLTGVKTDGGEPTLTTRAFHVFGASRTDSGVMNDFFDGTLAHVKVWNSSLTQSDVTDLYQRTTPFTSSPSPPSPSPPTPSSVDDADDICLNNVRSRKLIVIPAIMAKGAAALLGQLVGYVLPEYVFPAALEQAEEYFWQVENGKDCVDTPRITFCNEVISHPVARAVADKASERDLKAEDAYEELEESTEFEDVVMGSSICRQVTKQLICLDAFPSCNCKTDTTACENACQNANTCSEGLSGQKACASCINYCKKTCENTFYDDSTADDHVDGGDASSLRLSYAGALVVGMATLSLTMAWSVF